MGFNAIMKGDLFVKGGRGGNAMTLQKGTLIQPIRKATKENWKVPVTLQHAPPPLRDAFKNVHAFCLYGSGSAVCELQS